MQRKLASWRDFIVQFLVMLMLLSGSHARLHRIPLMQHLHVDQTRAMREHEILSPHRGTATYTYPHHRAPHSVSAVVSLSIRGGASFPSNMISYIKSSKSRCWILLVISIMIEAAATTLNKRAADTKSTQLFSEQLMCVLRGSYCASPGFL